MCYIRIEDFMGDFDDLALLNLIGPFPDRAARAREMARLESLPLGDPKYRGGYLFHADNRPTSAGAWRVVEPATVAHATTIKQFSDAIWGRDEDDDLVDAEDDIHPARPPYRSRTHPRRSGG